MRHGSACGTETGSVTKDAFSKPPAVLRDCVPPGLRSWVAAMWLGVHHQRGGDQHAHSRPASRCQLETAMKYWDKTPV
jgi:hypothetical protein